MELAESQVWFSPWLTAALGRIIPRSEAENGYNGRYQHGS